MKALILAAGYATRLYPLTKDYPKSLLKIRNRPLINYIVDKLEDARDIDEIVVVTNSKFIALFRSWARGLKLSKPLTLVDDLTKSDKDKRGAIADMSYAIRKKHIKDDLLVIGGDNLFNDPLDDFISFIKNNAGYPCIGAYNIRDKAKATKYGVVELNRKNRVVGFQEKPLKPKSSLVAMCLYYFPKDKLRLLGEYLKKVNKRDATGFYINWLRRKETVLGFVFDGLWFDIGHYNFYNEAKKKFKKKERSNRHA